MENKQEKDIYEFTNDEKSKAFDEIAKRYFVQNFGTMAKSDFETLLFSIFIEHCLDNGLPYDDYSLSRKLGVNQSRIRTLKLSKELKYPRGEKFKWKDAFAEDIKFARYDPSKRLVKMTIEDVNVLVELRHFMRTNGWYDEYQLNPRLFQCPLDVFVLLCKKLQDENLEIDAETKKKIKALAKAKGLENETYIGKILSGATEDGLKELVKTAGKDIISDVLERIPFGGVAKKAISYLIDIIKETLILSPHRCESMI